MMISCSSWSRQSLLHFLVVTCITSGSRGTSCRSSVIVFRSCNVLLAVALAISKHEPISVENYANAFLDTGKLTQVVLVGPYPFHRRLVLYRVNTRGTVFPLLLDKYASRPWRSLLSHQTVRNHRELSVVLPVPNTW